jgi:hypothetical protein
MNYVNELSEYLSKSYGEPVSLDEYKKENPKWVTDGMTLGGDGVRLMSTGEAVEAIYGRDCERSFNLSGGKATSGSNDNIQVVAVQAYLPKGSEVPQLAILGLCEEDGTKAFLTRVNATRLVPEANPLKFGKIRDFFGLHN